MPTKPCPCGSGEPRQERYDGYNIFLCFVCSKCEAQKMARFRPDIHTRYDADEQIEADY